VLELSINRNLARKNSLSAFSNERDDVPAPEVSCGATRAFQGEVSTAPGRRDVLRGEIPAATRRRPGRFRPRFPVLRGDMADSDEVRGNVETSARGKHRERRRKKFRARERRCAARAPKKLTPLNHGLEYSSLPEVLRAWGTRATSQESWGNVSRTLATEGRVSLWQG
jgi:hypothetical protein